MYIDLLSNMFSAARALPEGPATMQKGSMNVDASDTLVRAARELLRWNQTMLSEKAGVGLATVRRFETGAKVRPEKFAAIVAALQEAGVAFLGPHSPCLNIREGVALTAGGRTKKKTIGAASRPGATLQPDTAPIVVAGKAAKTERRRKPQARRTP